MSCKLSIIVQVHNYCRTNNPINIALIEKKGGRYTKDERAKRQNKVFNLHFELGYSAVKISEMIEVNRNTINSDINYWYSRLTKEWDSYDLDSWCMKQIHRLESQRARLFKDLEKVEKISLKISIEKLILDIDTRMMTFISKSISITEMIKIGTIKSVNQWAEDKKVDLRMRDPNKIRYASAKTAQKIEKLLNDDWSDDRGKM